MINFELSDELISIKEIGQFKLFTNFKIKGQGDLLMRTNSNKKGFGFEVHHEEIIKEGGRWVTKTTALFFTNDEMQDIFIESNFFYENRRKIERELKINQIIN
jgi:hypothetical protein